MRSLKGFSKGLQRQVRTCWILTFCAIGSVQAQSTTVVASDSGARMERLAAGTYAIVHDDATTDWVTGATDWPHGNTGVIVGDSGVLVVDATYLPSRARADIALIRTITSLPVRYLVNTHWHGDHTHGNGVYRAAFPTLTIIGQEANRDWIRTNLARYPAVVAAGGGGKRATLDRLEQLLRNGRDSAGKPLSAEQKRSLEDNIGRRRHEIDDFRNIVIAPPDLLFDNRMTIHLGRKRVELQNRGRANSPADVTVYLPDERVLFTGDIVVYPVPYVGASHPLPWIDVLREIEATPVTALVPGHGPVMTDHRYVRLVRELFEATRDRVRQKMEQGLLLDQIVKGVDLSDFEKRFLLLPHRAMAAYWDGTPAVLIERMHQCVQGYRC